MQGSFDFGVTIGAWAAGWRILPYPEDYTALSRRKGIFSLKTHFHPTGKVEVEKTAVGFTFLEKEPKPMDILLYNNNIDLAPNTVTHIKIDSVIQKDLIIYGVSAHTHYLSGRSRFMPLRPITRTYLFCGSPTGISIGRKITGMKNL